MAPNAQSAKDVLPADLDVVLWLDIVRLRGLWALSPDHQIAKVLAEYGLFVANTDAEATFWLHLLAESNSWWIACRPTRSGCRDVVVFARGSYDRPDPLLTLPDTTRPIDLGAGWFRYARKVRVGRQQAARVYVAPPDRIVVVSPAEVDAVERSLEQGHGEPPLLVEERGLFSMTLRPTALARIVEQRAPAAARLLREANVIRLWLNANPTALELNAVVAFASRERAERARQAFTLVASLLGVRDAKQSNAFVPVEVVGNDLVLHLQLRPPSSDQPPPPEGPKPGNAVEPAAQ